MIRREPDAALLPLGGPDAVAASTADVSPGNAVRRNLLVLGGGQATTWTMTLLFTLVVPRLLGPARMGLITSVWAVVAILSIVLGLGTSDYLAREMAARPDSAGRLVGTALVLRVVMAPVFVASALVYAHFARYGSEAVLVLWLASLGTLFMLLDAPLLAIFESRERMQYMAYTDVITKSVQGLIGIVVVVLGFGVVGLAGAGLVVSIAVLILGFRWVRPLVRIELRTTVRQLIGLVRASAAYFATGVFYFIYLYIDTVMLSLMTRDEVVGWYGAPTKILGALLFIPVIASTAWAPRLVRAFESSENELREEARTPIELVMVLSLPVSVATALAAQPLIPLLYGNAYRRSVPIMVILGFNLIPMYANIIFAQVLVAMRRQVRLTWIVAGAAIINPALNYLLIQVTEHRYHNGAIGAAICLLLTELLTVAAEFVFVGRRVLSSSSLLRVMRAAMASAGMGVVGYLARPLGWYVSLPLAGLTFLLLAWVLRVAGPSEKEALQAGLAKARGRFRSRQSPPTKK